MSFTNDPSERGPTSFGAPTPPYETPPSATSTLFLSWKKKVCLASAVIVCGTGLAAQFPSSSTSLDEEENFMSVPTRRETFFVGQSQNLQTKFINKPPRKGGYSEEPPQQEQRNPPDATVAKKPDEHNNQDQSGAPVLAQPQQRYAQDAASPDYVVAKPEKRIGKYSPPTTFRENSDDSKRTQRNHSIYGQTSTTFSSFTDSPPTDFGIETKISVKKPVVEPLETMDYSAFKKSELGLSLEKKNPLFEKKPPRSTAPTWISISSDEIVPLKTDGNFTDSNLPTKPSQATTDVAAQNVNEPYTQQTADSEKSSNLTVSIDLADIIPANQVRSRAKISSEPIISINLNEIVPASRKSESQPLLTTIPLDEIRPFNKRTRNIP